MKPLNNIPTESNISQNIFFWRLKIIFRCSEFFKISSQPAMYKQTTLKQLIMRFNLHVLENYTIENKWASKFRYVSVIKNSSANVRIFT